MEEAGGMGGGKEYIDQWICIWVFEIEGKRKQEIEEDGIRVTHDVRKATIL
jgi:hypothetical protein